MSWHRARTFPGRMGRLRLAGVIDAEHVEYESRLGRWRPAVASRYSRRLGAIELGVSAYDGTSREPFLEPVIGPHGEPGLVQHYAPIRQAGQDVQVTVGSWLLKAEAIQRSGARNLLGREQGYAAVVLGGEHAFYAVAVEFRRRVSDAWSLRAEAVALLSVDQMDHHHAMRCDTTASSISALSTTSD